jgi:tungstate transport system substrate-binding protein
MHRTHIATLILMSMFLIITGTRCQAEPERLILATTTSTYDSGLLDEIIPDFETRHDAQVDIIAVGTGQAISLGERGDADVILVHDQQKEEGFVAAGFGSERVTVMYNDFIIVGPVDDPVGIAGMDSAAKAFRVIAESQVPFVSRGDQSGTFAREQLIWKTADIPVDSSLDWYFSIGQGMGETLQFSNENRGYTLTDRGTYLSLAHRLGALDVIVGGASVEYNPDPSLRNDYSVIAVTAGHNNDQPLDLAVSFVEWLITAETQAKIEGYTRFGQPLFRPLHRTSP